MTSIWFKLFLDIQTGRRLWRIQSVSSRCLGAEFLQVFKVQDCWRQTLVVLVESVGSWTSYDLVRLRLGFLRANRAADRSLVALVSIVPEEVHLGPKKKNHEEHFSWTLWTASYFFGISTHYLDMYLFLVRSNSCIYESWPLKFQYEGGWSVDTESNYSFSESWSSLTFRLLRFCGSLSAECDLCIWKVESISESFFCADGCDVRDVCMIRDY